MGGARHELGSGEWATKVWDWSDHRARLPIVHGHDVTPEVTPSD